MVRGLPFDEPDTMFGAGPELRIIEGLRAAPGRKATPGEIAERAGLPLAVVQRALPKLVAGRILALGEGGSFHLDGDHKLVRALEEDDGPPALSARDEAKLGLVKRR